MKHTVAIAALVALSACSKGSPVFEGFDTEAGATIDGGSFGTATVRNTVAMTADPEQFRIDLARRFAADVNSTVNFAFNASTLDAEAAGILNQQANWIRQFPEVRFKVYGHTDKVGPDAYNKALGLRRAQTVVNYLVSQGVERSRLQAVVSFGETQPLVVTDGRERRNRRTVTEVSGFVERNPQVLDGKYARIIYRDYIASARSQTGLSGIQGSDFQTTE